MGNSNSSSNTAVPSKWTQSLEPPEPRNRMKRSYQQPRNYMVKVPPHKVLPAVSPSEVLHLRKTSNGAILHGGGTISGRKLCELELQTSNIKTKASHIRVSSENELSVSNSPNTSRTEQLERKEGAVIGRQCLPTFDGISSKKQMRLKKKYQAPLPPAISEASNGKNAELKHKGSKRMSRMFKTKHDTKTKLLTKELESELRLLGKESFTDDPDRVRLSPSRFKNTDMAKSDKIRNTPSPKNPNKEVSNTRKNGTSPTNLHEHKYPQEVVSASYKTGHELSPTKYPCSSNMTSNSFEEKFHTRQSSSKQRPLSREHNGIERSNGEGSPKNTFYFGMDEPSSSSVTNSHINKTLTEANEILSGVKSKKYSQVVEPAMNEKAKLEVRKKSESKSTKDELSNKIGHSSNIPSHSSPLKETRAQINTSTKIPQSDINHRYEVKTRVSQNHVGMDNKNEINGIGKTKSGKKHKSRIGAALPGDSSSELSSSEMDIPPLIRPTLPQKRNELPRFSPAAAWQALDSPHPSGRSVSSEDGFRYENHIQRQSRPVPPTWTANERSGDSGISAGAASPAHLPETTSADSSNKNSGARGDLSTKYTNRIGLNGSPIKCWTPQQDLDESSSDFEPDFDGPLHNPPLSRMMIPVPIGPQTPPKLTTRSNLFHQKKREGRDYEAKFRNSFANDDIPDQRMHRQSFGNSDSRFHSGNELPSENKSRQKRLGLRRNQLKHENRDMGLDKNWSLSRSEPNSLNETDLMMLSEPLSCKLHTEISESTDMSHERDFTGLGESRSEIGYGPSNMSFGVSYPNDNEHFPNDSEPNSLVLFQRPLHIMYLPSYDSRRLNSQANQRRAKSVDNLDASNPLFQRPRNHHSVQRNLSNELCRSTDKNFKKSGKYKADVEESWAESEDKARKKSKFKFQSTLRVLERKRLEKELTQEAKEREITRLKEVEDMRRVEEEFQKKRLRDATLNQSNIPNASEKQVVNVSLAPWDSVIRNNDFKELSRSDNSGASSSSHEFHKGKHKYPGNKVSLSQRQEPDGAPSLNTSSDLRKELIHASRKRNGISGGGANSELTQELSEYRQETRQYCDYRRTPRNYSSSPNRLVDASAMRGHERSRNSNRSRTTIHPEVICDIPGLRLPYSFNDSKFGGSLSNLLSDQHVPGPGSRSGPSSIISDNYRRDWAQRSSCGSVIGGLSGRRASSIISLHSAPGVSSSDCIRSSATNLNPTKAHHSRHRDLGKQVPSLTSSPMPQATCNDSSNESSIIDHDKNSRSRHIPDVFQPQPFMNNKSREYRPVVFKPKSSQQTSTFAILHSVN